MASPKATPAKAPAKRTSKASSKQAMQTALKAKQAKQAKEAAAEGTDSKLRAKVRAAYDNGATRTQLREQFKLTYPQVYNMTKDMGANSRDRIFIDDPDNKGVQISRRDAMRRDFAAGMSVGDVGRKYGVIYQVARQALLDLLPEGGLRATKPKAAAKATGGKAATKAAQERRDKANAAARARRAAKAKATA
jgi:hypothetical protein